MFDKPCNDKKSIPVKNDRLSEFTLYEKELVNEGLLLSDEILIKAQLNFSEKTEELFSFSYDFETKKGLVSSSEDTVLADRKSACIRMSTYVSGNKGEKRIKSLEVVSTEKNLSIADIDIYVIKRPKTFRPEGYRKQGSERVRMGGLCFPFGCLEYIKVESFYSKLVLVNDSLDSLKTRSQGIRLVCRDKTDPEKEPLLIKIKNTEKKVIAPGESVYFDNKCPENHALTAVNSVIRGLNSHVALDGWFSVWAK